MTLTLKDAIKELKQIFRRNNNVEFAYIFGSIIRGRMHPLSDIDIAVYLKDDSLSKIMELNSQIIDELGNNIDLIVLNKAPYNLRYSIIFSGLLIFSRNEVLRINFESEAMLLGIEEKEALDKIRRGLLEGFLA
ncbi:MAG: type VII toxin-antitoxin system MntA family adenylyltransferase antitoxin [Candidatus Njordarchaeia archaeon]|nr:nucleotidyltransferase domain-containing protein [Candidatus Korarchaeota archaeon]